MIVWLWDAPPHCGVSGSLTQAQEVAATAMAATPEKTVVVESALVMLNAGLDMAYTRTGQQWRGSLDKDGSVRWDAAVTYTGPPGPLSGLRLRYCH